MPATRLSRREFVRSASMAALGVALPFSAKSYSRILGANDRVRVGLVGFSDRAKNSLIPAFLHSARTLNMELVGLSDIWIRRRQQGEAYLRQLGVSSSVSRLNVYTLRRGEAYLRQLGVSSPFIARNNDELYDQKDLDAVIISTADFQHAFHCIEAVQAGKDAYVEKPLAESMADNRAVLKAVRESGRIVQVGSQRRSGANYDAAAAFIRSGKFGPITMVEMCWNVNQPGRWRRPDLVAAIQEKDTDWQRYLINRPYEPWDARKYLEYRLFWPYSSGIPGQWMSHQIDTVHWFSGYPYPRSVAANGGIYVWKDGRANADTLTAVFDYGPANDLQQGFQVVYSSRMHNAAGGVKEVYFSNAGELNLDANRISPNGGLQERYAAAMGMQANLLPELNLGVAPGVETGANTGGDPMTTAHMRNWMDCLRTRNAPNAPVEAGYNHSVANLMCVTALHTGKRVSFDPVNQEILSA